MRCLILISFIYSSLLYAADEVEKKGYRWIGKDGSVVFSSTPPPPGINAEEIELRDADTVIKEDRIKRQRLLNQSEGQTLRAQNNRERRENIKQKIDALRAELAEARTELKEGKEPRPGETQHLAGGRTKLAPAYFERMENQEKRVEELEKRIDELNNELKKTF